MGKKWRVTNTYNRNSSPWLQDIWCWHYYNIFSCVMLCLCFSSCVHLLAELSQQKPYTDKVSSLLPLVAESARHKHYSQHYSYLETVFKQVRFITENMFSHSCELWMHCYTQLPVIARALGKRLFKRHLELFLDPMFYALVSWSVRLWLVCEPLSMINGLEILSVSFILTFHILDYWVAPRAYQAAKGGSICPWLHARSWFLGLHIRVDLQCMTVYNTSYNLTLSHTTFLSVLWLSGVIFSCSHVKVL